jgi:hypothetical protein
LSMWSTPRLDDMDKAGAGLVVVLRSGILKVLCRGCG